ncbi:hypothetical protein ES704_03788 [subsurface metagenome]|jgi:hypothetical protein
MAKERLSKLQRWILGRCYNSGLDEYEIWRSSILQFFDWRGRNKAEVSITNSLKNLFKKGYIDVAVGFLGGRWVLEEQREDLEKDIGWLEEVKKTGKIEYNPYAKKLMDAKFFEDKINWRKEIVEKRNIKDYGENIKRLKLTNKGIELAKSLNIN